MNLASIALATAFCLSALWARGGDEPALVGGDVLAPTAIGQCFADLKYTDEAREAQVEGLVILQADIDGAGKVLSTAVLRGLGHGLDEVAQAALGACSFEPARSAATGAAMRVLHTVPVRFKLKQVPEQPAAGRVGDGLALVGEDVLPPKMIGDCLGNLGYTRKLVRRGSGA